MEIRIKNQLNGRVEFCLGVNEYRLEPEQDVIAPVSDGDCMYLDTLIPCRKRTPAEVALNSITAVLDEAKRGQWKPADALQWIQKIVDDYFEDNPIPYELTEKAGDIDD
jgi:hypothetical protein